MFYIEEAVYLKFQHVVGKGNVSREVEIIMDNINGAATRDISKVNIERLQKELEILELEYTKKTTEIQTKRNTLEQAKQERLKKQQEALELEQKIIEEKNVCINCQQVITSPKKYPFTKGNVCQVCFMSSDTDMINKCSGRA